jgi:hypothetical protein
MGLALGVPASLLGHVLLFGSEHEMGGRFCAAVFSVMAAAVASFTALFVALAWRCNRTADGSILAARLRESLPGTPTLFVGAALCFTLCESLESAHAMPIVPATIAALLLASAVVMRLARLVVRAIADLTVAITHAQNIGRNPPWRALRAEQPVLHCAALLRRNLARPPPAAIVASRA